MNSGILFWPGPALAVEHIEGVSCHMQDLSYQIFYHCLYLQHHDALQWQNVRFVTKGLYYNVEEVVGRVEGEGERGGQGWNPYKTLSRKILK